ncbi:glycosyltransferase family 4 protein [Olivibacter sp. CPCC 100613]|uniref:glycosyltransferase family 4 protein n=1 Tax=Olivibacter sp. CPCC 100613 TaxID=3079931 RepID=UPI002FFC4C15
MLFFANRVLGLLDEEIDQTLKRGYINEPTKNRRMKIVLFNTFYYPKLVGGAEVSVQLLAEELVRNGHKVYVFTIGQKEEVTRINGVIIIRFVAKNISSVYDNKKHNFFVTIIWLLVDSLNPFYHFKLSHILKRIKPDVVHTNNVMGFSPAIWLTIKRLKLPLVHTLRDYYLLCHKCNMFDGTKNCDGICKSCKLTHVAKKWLLDQPDVMVGVSQFTVNKHQEKMNAKESPRFEVIYNAVKLPSTSNSEKSEEVLRIGYMGRIAKDKGVEYLVTEAGKLAEKVPCTSFELLLAGEGEEEYIAYLKQQLRGVSYRFLGKVKPADFYKEVQLTVVPSIWNEPFGRVVIESFSFGVPVCMASRGGLTELHNSSVSWLFNFEDTNGLSSILSEILQNKNLLADKAAHTKEYAAKFSITENASQYTELYTSLKNKSGMKPLSVKQ